MPVLANPKHEAFAQAYVKGEHAGNATAAHKEVYGAKVANGVQAYKMLKLAHISARVTEIQSEIAHINAQANDDAAQRLGITKEWVLSKLLENTNKAMKREDGSTVNRALEMLGRHVGVFLSDDAPRVNVNVGLQFVDRPPPETHSEWEARRKLELAPKPRLINGNGKSHS